MYIIIDNNNYNYITDPVSKKKINIYSKKGSEILKSYLRHFENKVPRTINNSNRKSKGARNLNNLKRSFGGSSLSANSRINDDVFFKEVEDCRDVIKYCSTSKTNCKEDTYETLSKKHFRNIRPIWLNRRRPSMCNGINCEKYYNLCYVKNNPDIDIMRIPVTPDEEIREGIIRAALFPPIIPGRGGVTGWTQGTYTNERISQFMRDNINNMCHIKIQIDSLRYYHASRNHTIPIEDYKHETAVYTEMVAMPDSDDGPLPVGTLLKPFTIKARIQTLNTLDGDISVDIPITIRYVTGGYGNIYFYLQLEPIEHSTIGIFDVDSILYVPHTLEYITETLRR